MLIEAYKEFNKVAWNLAIPNYYGYFESILEYSVGIFVTSWSPSWNFSLVVVFAYKTNDFIPLVMVYARR